ncbi:MAG: LamG domain-containing protein, partial [Planctomycetota bacterium]
TFDEGQGRTAKDSAGRYDGIMHGWVGWFNDGKIGGAIALDSEDGYVEVQHIGTFDAVTLAMWIKVSSIEKQWISILHNDGWSSNDVHYHLIGDGHFRIAVNGSRVESIGEYNQHDPRPISADQDSSFAFTEDKFGQWHHIAIVYNSQAKTADFYVNGELDVRRRYEEVVPVKLGPLRIGSHDISSREFDGSMDDVRIYDYALSEEEVAELYKDAGSAKSEPTLTSSLHTVRKVYLPDADKIKGAVLDLAGGDLLDAGEGDDHLIGRFEELGKGDIAYDTVKGDIAYDTVNSSHALICLRGAKAEKHEHEGNTRIVLNPYEQTADVKVYKLDKVPCVLIVTVYTPRSRVGLREYLISIISADNEEMILEYTLLK